MRENKIGSIVSVIVQFITFIILIRFLVLKDWFKVFTCFYTLFIFYIPSFIKKKNYSKFSNLLEICFYIFIFGTEIMGEVLDFYLIVPWWDVFLHTFSGFLLTGIGIYLVALLNQSKSKYHILKPIFVVVFAFCFSITCLVGWEFIEFAADNILDKDMQKDSIITTISSVNLNNNKKNKPAKVQIKSLLVNGEDWLNKYGGYLEIGLYDTMNDLICGIIGSITFSYLAFCYLKKKEGYSLIKDFIPKMR